LINVLARGAPGYRKWHLKVRPHPGWESLGLGSVFRSGLGLEKEK